jgi:hypothetical protein
MKDFTLYPEALELKQLGFDEPCFGRYNNNDDHLLIAHTEKYIISNGVDRSEFFILAPTYSQAFRWFREKNGMVFNLVGSGPYYPSIAFILIDGNSDIELGEYDNYEEAELACLRKMIEIFKSHKK